MSVWFARPVVFTSDNRRALDFYVNRLGFIETARYEENGEPLVLTVERGGCAILLTPQWPERAGQSVLFVSLDPDDYEAAKADFAARGAPTKEGWWGYPLIIVADPDGNELWFPSPYPPN